MCQVSPLVLQSLMTTLVEGQAGGSRSKVVTSFYIPPPDHLSLCFPSHLRILKLHQKFGIHFIRIIGFNEFFHFKCWSVLEWRYLMGGQKLFQELHPIWRPLVCGWHYRQIHLGVQPKCPCRQFLQPISAHYWRPFKWSDQCHLNNPRANYIRCSCFDSGWKCRRKGLLAAISLIFSTLSKRW